MNAQAKPEHYANAIYELALDVWTRQLGEVQQALARDPGLRSAVADVQRGTRARLDLLNDAVRGGLDPAVRRFLGTLVDAGDLNQLDAILDRFHDVVRRGPSRPTARVVTAVPLTPAEQQALRDRVARRFGSNLEFQFDVDPAVIGGVLLRVGDQVIDGTVAAKLGALREKLTT